MNYVYRDGTVDPGRLYEYRLVDISYSGERHIHAAQTVKTPSGDYMIQTMTLYQNFPNPFNPTTTISYDLPERSDLNLTIYDVTGRDMVILENQEQPAGHYEFQWNGVDESGNQVSTGIYLARLQAGEYSKTIKMVLLR